MIKDDDAWMAWFIKEYDDLEDPDLRAELMTCHSIHPEVLASERRRLARLTQTSCTERTIPPPVSPPVPRTSRATRRPATPRRRAGRPRTYHQITRTRRIRTTGRTVTITTTTVTVTTVVTVTTNS
ncbi:hypothetical protein ABZ424_02710 [Streptomyces sp. NPDC005790]|uniref:hypothetical protein n=1 Tax=Streptomyces sp. NPDC005790 TaxID=3154777 RepID=UPI0033D80CC4